MSTSETTVESLVGGEYKYGFVTDIRHRDHPEGPQRGRGRLISSKKGEPAWMTEWPTPTAGGRRWRSPITGANFSYPPVDYQDIIYYAAPKNVKPLASLDEVDPELIKTYEKLGIPLREQKLLSPAGRGCHLRLRVGGHHLQGEPGQGRHHLLPHQRGAARAPRPGEAVPGLGGARERQLLRGAQLRGVQRRLLRVHPEGRPPPTELSTYFRINTANSGQFERTLIVADEGAYVSYLEGCTAPKRDTNQLHAAVVELVALKGATIKYSTVQNWYAGDAEGKASTTSSPSAAAPPRMRRSPGRRWRPARPSPGNT